jgi:hypothetical protein
MVTAKQGEGKREKIGRRGEMQIKSFGEWGRERAYRQKIEAKESFRATAGISCEGGRCSRGFRV